MARGFTLLEIVLAMFVFSLLVASIFGIVSGTTQLADEMERGHEHDAQAHSFAQFCERTLRQLPAQAAVRVKVKESGRQYLSQFAILNAPTVLGSGAGGGNGLTIFETFQQPDGYLGVRVKLIAADDVAAYESGQGDTPGAGLVLLNDVARCEWKFFNPLSNQWESDWNVAMSFAALVANRASATSQVLPVAPANGGVAAVNGNPTTSPGTAVTTPNLSQVARPTLVELTLAMRTEAPRRFVFWVPPAQIPMGVGLGQQNAPAAVTPVQTPPTPAPGH